MQINECMSNPCQNGQCFDFINGYRCLCDIGFTGPNCEIRIGSCLSTPCLNNGLCRDNVNIFKDFQNFFLIKILVIFFRWRHSDLLVSVYLDLPEHIASS